MGSMKGYEGWAVESRENDCCGVVREGMRSYIDRRSVPDMLPLCSLSRKMGVCGGQAVRRLRGF